MRHTLFATGFCLLLALPAAAQTVLLGDHSVDGSLCAGASCTGSESFTGADLKIKVINPELLFEDSSAVGAPTRDWRVLTNEDGSENFVIEDVDAGNDVFWIEGNSPANSIHVSALGRLGLRTSIPAEEIHIAGSTSPTIRFETSSDGSAWDIKANSNFWWVEREPAGNFPFVLADGAPSESFWMVDNGDIGLGTDTPQGALDIFTGAESSGIFFTNDSGSWKFNHNVNTGRFNIGREGANTPFKIDPASDDNLLRIGFGGSDRVEVNGDLVVSGNCSETDGACADYVFGPDHERLTLPDLRAFIADNKHLPNVPSEADIRANGVSMAHFSGRLLEKVEELTLYTLEQEDRISGLTKYTQEQEDRISAQNKAIADLLARLAVLESTSQD